MRKIKSKLKKAFPFLISIREFIKFYAQKYTWLNTLYGRLYIKPALNHKLEQSKHPNIFFIHIPKNAGTSVKAVLPHNAAGHWRLSELEKIGVSLNQKHVLYITRNPYTRLLSAYRFFLQTSEKTMMNRIAWRRVHHEIKKYGSFKEFVSHLESFKYKWVWHFDRQVNYVLHTQHAYPLIRIRYENLTEDYQKAKESYKLPDIPHRNKSTNSTSSGAAPYDQETADMVYEKYKDDFEQFNYDKESWKAI